MVIKAGCFLKNVLGIFLLSAAVASPVAHAAPTIVITKACGDPICSDSPYDFTIIDLGTSLTKGIKDIAVGERRSFRISKGDFIITEYVPSSSVLTDISVTGATAYKVDLASSSVQLTLAADDEVLITFTNANAVPEPTP